MQEYIDKAFKELKVKNLKTIQTETALTWCGRACAAKILGLDGDAREYAHEAVEHASLSGNVQFVSDIFNILNSYKVEF